MGRVKSRKDKRGRIRANSKNNCFCNSSINAIVASATKSWVSTQQ